MQNLNPNPIAASHQACAACNHQRKKCASDCELAHFLPISRKRDFSALQQVYGVSNVQKMIKIAGEYGNPLDDAEVKRQNKEGAVNSMAKEAEMRLRDPVNGIYGQYMMLYQEKEQYRHQLAAAMQRMQAMEQRMRMYEARDLAAVADLGSVVDAKEVLPIQGLFGNGENHMGMWYSSDNYHQD